MYIITQFFTPLFGRQNCCHLPKHTGNYVHQHSTTYQIKITLYTLWEKTSTSYVIKRLHPHHAKIFTAARWDADPGITWGEKKHTFSSRPPCFHFWLKCYITNVACIKVLLETGVLQGQICCVKM